MKRSGLLLLLLLYVAFSQHMLAEANRLVSLVAKGDVAGVKALIASGAGVNATDDTNIRGWTALMASATIGSVSIADLLIRAGADVNAKNEFSATALDIATANGHTEVASRIMAAGGRDRYGRDRFSSVVGGVAGLARCKLAVREPVMQARFPGLFCVSDISELTQLYNHGFADMKGEQVTISLKLGDKSLASATWSTVFPQTASAKVFQGIASGSVGFKGADVSIADLLKRLFARNHFTPEDLAQLGSSKISEVRIAVRMLQ
jgi:Ankyrin repeat